MVLLKLKSTDRATKMLKNTSMYDILQIGKKLILEYFEECKIIFKRAYNLKLDTHLYEYKYVMEKAFDEFVTNYSARFNATDICASIDYPLLNQQAYEMTSKGVLFIKEYYSAIMYENMFCSMLDKTSISNTLAGFGEIYNYDYNDLLFNISEVLFNNYLSARIIGKNNNQISISKCEINNLYDICMPLTKEQLKVKVTKLFLQQTIFAKNPSLAIYFKKYIPMFCDNLLAHSKENTLENYIVITNL